MGDFITLTCPSCGANLAVSPSKLTLVCQHCGAEHMIRREAGAVILETHNVCPTCHKNNNVQKVSSIVADRTTKSNGVTIEKRDYRDSEGRWYTSSEQVPFTGITKTELAQQLSPPVKPPLNLKTDWGGCLPSAFPVFTFSLIAFFSLIFAIMLIAAFIFASEKFSDPKIFSNAVALMVTYGLPSCTIFIICVICIPSVIIYFNKRSEKTKKENGDLIKKNEKEVEIWNKAMARWNKLFYCFLDDIIFIPGENETAPPSKTIEFVFKEKTEEIKPNPLIGELKSKPMDGELKPNPFGFEKKIK